MSLGAHDVRYSFTDYIAFERTSNVKHEFLLGQIYAMAGGTPKHAALTAAVSGLLFGQLLGKDCQLFSSDLRVRAGDLVTYPDVSIVCGPLETDPKDPNTVLNPTAIIEVTSPSTKNYDRGKKLASYQAIDSLRLILIVAHDHMQVDCFQYKAAQWRHEVHTEGTVLLPDIGASLSVATLYNVG